MTLENQILDAVIQDHKERTVLGLTPFGDIFFKEANGYGQELFSVCLILPPVRPKDNPAPKGVFAFEVLQVALTEKEFKSFVKTGFGSLMRLSSSKKFQERYEIVVLRYGLKASLKERLGKLETDEVYGYCDDDDYNSTNPHAEKVNKVKYLEEVLAFAQQYPSKYYTDLYDLAKHDTGKDFVLKEYLGYGFTIPAELFDKTQLKALAIYKQSVKDLTPEKLLRLKNLNALGLDNVGGLSQEIIDVIHQLPYLVNLSLTNSDKYIDKNSFSQIPAHLDTLKSLRYFSFVGNVLSDWSEVVKLKNLRSLDLSDCGLTTISEHIGQLTFLEELNLSNNMIQYLPEGLAQLKDLKILRLNGNQLVEIPRWIGELKNLQLLDLSQAELTTLPSEIVALSNLEELNLKKNPFNSLSKDFDKLPKKIVKIEMRNQALYDAKAKAKLDTYPKGNVKFESDFNFKLMVINQLMYIDKVLLPKFDVWGFAKTYDKRKINIEEEGYAPISEVISYFKGLEISMDLLIDIKELQPDGGDEIYRQIIPFWHGEDDQFDVKSIEDVKYLPNMRAINNMNFSRELTKELRAQKIKVANY